MTKYGQQSPERAAKLVELEAALDAYGADRTRWPAPVRHGLSAFIAGDAEARQRLDAAAVFDRLLDAAPTLGADRIAALTNSISAIAERGPRVVHSGEAPREPTPGAFRRRESAWAAAALAASLVLGIFAGQSPVGDASSTLLAQGFEAGDSSQQLALIDDGDSLLDEDLL